MIGPGRYGDMMARRDVTLVADPTGPVRGLMPVGDRLEAALDAAMAESTWGILWGCRGEARVAVPLASIRAWLGSAGHRGVYGEWKYEWTKRDVEMLFASRGGVRDRYVAGGWARCECRWESQQARSITFAFLTDYGVREREKEKRKAKKKADAADAALRARAMRAMIELADALGVERPAGVRMRISGVAEDAVGHLEDLRLAAKLQRFDLDMSRLDGGADGRTTGASADE